MRTTEFPWYQAPFFEFNVPQAAVIPFIDWDGNLVVSFATAVGKTVIAECCFGYHLSQKEGSVAYISPYRSLSAEKHEQWSDNVQLSRYDLVLSTGDHRATAEDFTHARLANVTLESFDSKTRSPAYKDWIKRLDCVVFDEAHVIGVKGRGGALECAMMRLTTINPRARIVLLSATLGNAMSLARWLKALNGKPTKSFVSEWRPNVVEPHIHVVEEYEKEDKAIELVRERTVGEKMIVFVHSKAVGARLVKAFRKMGIRSGFHNASVSKPERAKMEQAFNDKASGFDVLVSTSTLGAGVNIG